MSPPRFHRAWSVAIVAFLALVGAASFRAAPSVLIDPLHEDFGWVARQHLGGRLGQPDSVRVDLAVRCCPDGRGSVSGRSSPRRWRSSRSAVVLTIFMTSSWQLILLWGVFVGLGTGSMALALSPPSSIAGSSRSVVS